MPGSWRVPDVATASNGHWSVELQAVEVCHRPSLLWLADVTNASLDDDTTNGGELFSLGDHVVLVTDPVHLLGNLEVLVQSIRAAEPAFAVVPIGRRVFMQVMALDDGSLRIESSATAEVLAANLGFEQLVEQHPHVAVAAIPAGYAAADKMAAEAMMRLAVDVHHMLFPALLEFHLCTVEEALEI